VVYVTYPVSEAQWLHHSTLVAGSQMKLLTSCRWYVNLLLCLERRQTVVECGWTMISGEELKVPVEAIPYKLLIIYIFIN
jgi:hypothetical protein